MDYHFVKWSCDQAIINISSRHFGTVAFQSPSRHDVIILCLAGRTIPVLVATRDCVLRITNKGYYEHLIQLLNEPKWRQVRKTAILRQNGLELKSEYLREFTRYSASGIDRDA